MTLDLLRRHEPLWHLLIATVALGSALVAQHGFGKFPCHLCLLQRYPYGAVLLLAGGLAFVRNRRPRAVTLLRALIATAYATTALIAAYHVGVEQGWIEGPSGCSSALNTHGSLEALRAQILGAALVSCKEASVFLFGLSMAAWNAWFGFTACLFTLYFWRHHAV